MPQDPNPPPAWADPPLDVKERRKRKREGIAIALLGLLFVALTIAEFQLTKVSSTLPFVTSIFFFGLLNINIVILIALVWLVFRNLGKLFIERRRKILGARLKTKLVLAFVSFSLIPTLMLFAISAMYINSSFDKWFSLKIQNTLQASLDITRTYYLNTEHTAMHFAEHLAKNIGRRMRAPLPAEDAATQLKPPPEWIEGYLESQRELLALDAAEFYRAPLEPRVIAQRASTAGLPAAFARLSLDLLDKAFSGESLSKIQHVGSGDLIRCLAPVHAGGNEKGPIVGVAVVSSYIPVSLVNKVDEIASVYDDYKENTNPLKYPMKTTYLVILIMITLVIIFVAIWIGLYLARELTVPVERLVYGAQAVGAGNLDVRVPVFGHDEISTLVQSFNKMTQDLRDNRARLLQAGTDLEKRRLQLEAVLANVNTGVVSIDSSGEITTFNPAAAKLLKVAPGEAVGRRYRDVLQGEASPLADVVSRAFEAASKSGVASGAESTQWNFRDDSSELVTSLSAVVTPLHESEAHWGVVAVVDDMTHLIKGQREMAWREVARRIAHEIKNPLTPIKLSAQRLQRRLGAGQAHSAENLALLQECTETIIKHTDELKEMVNEFSNFARFPEANPAPHDLNEALKESLKLFEQGHQDVEFDIALEPKLPIFEFDRDQIKRVVINLVDNAVAALSAKPPEQPKKVTVSTHYHEQLQIAVIEVGDNGFGMTEDVKARVFEPYFSTKKEGTGLGLAIAKRIVNDHDGFIRIHSAPGEGTKFVIEIPTSVRIGPERRRTRQGGPGKPLE
jgi:two-component system nitrogen regulation sensor histidine kinase NtrY